ncbi:MULTISPECIES: SufB/SufD family protein [Caproicibacterium]|uniref:SufD family Fe-S cluster assembly protein n=1 Tax=Caproicibacterium argilliputei TaxID=3030016 RepID=A0AA97D9C5_9FIRM|nr:SufD family Fe-S cluster assembly protein [Caproicibacterium argilliputei]WOC32644.1 SufD family Fe-S cluster assembly protein [Caproicibacterium argilliputei]
MEQQLKNINTLPALTWNHLGVNRSVFLAQRPQAKTAAPQISAAFQQVETGMGREAEDFAVQNCTVSHSIEAEENTEYTDTTSMRYALTGETPVVDVTLIHAHAGSRVTVLQSYTAGDDTACFHGGLTKIIADAGAKVRLVQVQLLNGGSRSFNDVGVQLAENAQVEVVQAELGAARAFAGCLALLEGYRSRFDADTIYFGDEARKLDLNYVARHTGKKTVSEMHAAGALLGKSDKIYRGTIDFIRGASRSEGHEAEETLLFSPQARNRTVPLILCSEEDVQGQHAATIGKINAQRLFYLQSRGLTEPQAKQLMIEAQFAPVIEKVPDEALQQEMKAYLGRRMQLD